MADPSQMPNFRPNGPVPQGSSPAPPGQHDRGNMPGNYGPPPMPGYTGKFPSPMGGNPPPMMSQGQFRGQGPPPRAMGPPLVNNIMGQQNGFNTPSSVPQGFQQNYSNQGANTGQNMLQGGRMPVPSSQSVPNGPMNMSPGIRQPPPLGQWPISPQSTQSLPGGINTLTNSQGVRPPTNFDMSQRQNVGPSPIGNLGPRQMGPQQMGQPQMKQGQGPSLAGPPVSSSTGPPLLPGQYRPHGPPMSGPPTSRPGMKPLISEPQNGPPPMTANSEAPAVGLPVPFHGQAQYSHQVDNKLTPGLTPSNSEPPSQKSSRTNTPDMSGQNFDALEGQFSNVQSPVQTPTSGPHTSVGGGPPSSMPLFPPTPAGTGPPVAAPPFPPTMTGGVPPTSAPSFPPTMAGGVPPTKAPSFPPTMAGGVPPTSAPSFPPTSAMGGPPTSYSSPAAPSSQEMDGRASGITGQRKYPQMPNYMNPTPTSQWQQQTFPPQGPPQNQFSGPPVSMGYGQQPGYQQPQVGMTPPGPGSYQPQSSLPQQPGGNLNYQSATNSLSSSFGAMEIQEGHRIINLLNEKRLIPRDGVETPKPKLQNDFKKVNCNTEVFRCTLSSIPQTSALLNKCRLPLGILIHPFKDLSQLPVIQSSVIVRCRSCRTYINPFVFFVDQRRWKCNLCYRVNELPDEFSFDPVSKTYGDPQRRPEIKSATIEFIAPSEYMLRPPQPAVYLYVIDVSFNAIETGYLNTFCQILLEELDKVPGDSRTLIGFLAFDRALHFFNLAEGLSQPQMLIVSDLDDIFLPCPDDLLVNLQECKELVIDLLNQLPSMFEGNMETGSALGAALQAAFKLTTSTGGRVSVFQTVLPSVGPGALQAREDSSQRSSKDVGNLGPATDFYKKIALDCSAQQIAVDLFMLNGQYADLATISCVSKYSGGCISYYPSFHSVKNPSLADKFEADLRRYLTRKIGFESVMRIRCTKGLSIHTFHGNFFVRSTDLLSLPNINPDAAFGMQMSIEESLTDMSSVCFQAALLYTSSKGERRIRVHTMCLPVTNQISEVFSGADQQAIVALLAKMAVDRSVSSSLSDAREAMINAAVDSLSGYGNTVPASQRIGAVPTPFSIRLLPTYVLAMLKSVAFRLGNTRLDDRVFAMQNCKSLPVSTLIQNFYADLYPVHNLDDTNSISRGDTKIPQPIRLHLSSANIDRHGVFLMDTVDSLYLYVGSATSDQYLQDVLDVPNFMSIPEDMIDLPELDNPTSEKLRNFVSYLLDTRPGGTTFHVIREDSKHRGIFFLHMVEDRTESAMSYYEFLQHLQRHIKS